MYKYNKEQKHNVQWFKFEHQIMYKLLNFRNSKSDFSLQNAHSSFEKLVEVTINKRC